MTALLLVLTALISSAVAVNPIPGNKDIMVAVQEMQKANFFSFVMLVDMVPPGLIQGNITFLMPNDRILSNTNMARISVADFLLRHSIHKPLLIEDLENFPTGSIIPTSRLGFMLKITNKGRRHFYLNNVRITSPNICTAGSIKCHGIDGVMQATMFYPRPSIRPPRTPSCSNSTSSPTVVAAAPSPPSLAATPPTGGFSVTALPPTAVEVSGHPISSSPRMGNARGVALIMPFIMLTVVKL